MSILWIPMPWNSLVQDRIESKLKIEEKVQNCLQEKDRCGSARETNFCDSSFVGYVYMILYSLISIIIFVWLYFGTRE